MDETSLTADVRAGTFGPDLEAALGTVGAGYTLGHWPQSMDLSTVGGWLACRGAGQYSTRYGKIEDMVIGLEVVLADGRIVRTGGARATRRDRAEPDPALRGQRGHARRHHRGPAAAPPTSHRRRSAVPSASPPSPTDSRRAAGSSAGGPHRPSCACTTRRNRAATSISPTPTSSSSSTRPIPTSSRAPWRSSTPSAARESGAQPLDRELVERWLGHRNDVSALAPLWRGGIVVDTAEVSGPWAVLPGLFDEVVAALSSIEGTLAASAHQSHAYTDGACLYFTFGGRGPEGDAEWRERYYRQAWDAVTDATMAHGAAISHHHGIGLNRSRFLPACARLGLRGAPRTQGDVRPHGHPQSRQVRPGLPVRTATLGMSSPGGSILVVDVGTSGVRAAIVRPDATVEHEHRVPLLPDSPAPGLVEFDAARMAEAVLTVARSRLGRRGAGRPASGIANQRASSIVWERATRRARSPRASAGRTCAPSAPASSSRPRGSASLPTRRPPR